MPGIEDPIVCPDNVRLVNQATCGDGVVYGAESCDVASNGTVSYGSSVPL